MYGLDTVIQHSTNRTVPHNHWFVPLGCHLFTEFLGNVGMPIKILIPPCTYALLGLPAYQPDFAGSQ